MIGLERACRRDAVDVKGCHDKNKEGCAKAWKVSLGTTKEAFETMDRLSEAIQDIKELY